MPETYDYDDETQDVTVDYDSPSDVVFVLDGVTTF